jgi:hypothetical protein
MEYNVSYLQQYFNFTNPRWHVFSRILAALFGGYALATSSSIFITQILMGVVGNYQAMHIGLMLTFLVYSFAAMWVFSVTSATRAWLGLIKLNIIFIVISWLLIQVNS